MATISHIDATSVYDRTTAPAVAELSLEVEDGKFKVAPWDLDVHESLHAILADDYGTKLQSGEESIETAPATPREAGPLRVDVGRQCSS